MAAQTNRLGDYVWPVLDWYGISELDLNKSLLSPLFPQPDGSIKKKVTN
jgi:hypothetical protein